MGGNVIEKDISAHL